MEHLLFLNQKENNWSDLDRKTLLGFAEYVFSVLKIEKPVTIKLKQSYDGDDLGISINLRLAYVIPEDRLIIIYCKDRGLLDVLRSIAHELVHIEQKDKGMLDGKEIAFYLPSEDSPGYGLEYEAYGKSGIIVRNYRAILNQ